MHPTVFDNLKTVLEGCIYDFEGQNVLEVVSRNDLVDLANLTRSFNIGVLFDTVYGQIEINFPENMWMDEVVFSRNKVKTGLHFVFEIPKSLYELGYLQWYKFIQKKIWNVDVQLIEEKKMNKEQIVLTQKLYVTFKEDIGEIEVERLMDVVDHFVYVGERIVDLLGETERER